MDVLVQLTESDYLRIRAGKHLETINNLPIFGKLGQLAYEMPALSHQHDRGEQHLKSRGEIESAICEAISNFEQEFMGRGPKEIRTHLIDDILIVRLQGVLTAAEQHLATTHPTEKGRDLIKEVRTQLIESARHVLENLILKIAGVKTVSLHHDISTVAGEEIMVFTLAESPAFRETKRK